MSITFSATVRATFTFSDGETVQGWDFAPGVSEDLEVNMANGNAAHLLATLGFDAATEMWDALPVPAAEFLGRVLVALALNPTDAGVPATTVVEGPMTVVDCGRMPGYTDERLAQLHELAVAAAAVEGAHISWG